MTEAEYDEWSRRMLEDGDPQAEDHLAERALGKVCPEDFIDEPDERELELMEAAEFMDRHERGGSKAEYEHYEAMQMREWGRIQDVPDSSVEDPEHGRYARTNHSKANRKRRLKRNRGEYGPRRPRPPDERPVDPWEIHSDHSAEGNGDVPF